ncbi:restriction endonuclease subunit S [Roseixanthobacter liquoris]|uniref:restriction endonuclease subunit S n=1 Tax=Roseixanthobacter liquoris TaxID=3119921 RepID=UPI0037268F5B
MKRYPTYKPSGVKWMGEVPEGWKLVPLWAMFRRVKRTDYPDAELLSVYRDYGVVPKSSRDDNFNKPSEDLSQYQLVEPGDLVINKMKAWQGSVAVSKYRGIVSPAYFVFTPKHDQCDRFLHYLMRSAEYTFSYLTVSKGIRPNQWDLEPQEHSQMAVLLPPPSEQAAIAAFLDRETAKIDALVEEQRRLIALLAEKRQAVISHAVTKGLDPTVPMKDSGVEWLGEVPAHWGISRVKNAASHVVDCLHTTPAYDGDVEFPAVRTADLQRGKLLLHQARLVSHEVYLDRIQRLPPIAGDVLYSREGERFGMAALVPAGVDLCLGQRMMMFRIKATYHSGYVMWALNSEAVFQQVLAKVAGATSPHVNITDIVNFHIPTPPPSEHAKIYDYINEQIIRIDNLTDEAESSITLLQERRAALISAAVTGKIDVRGLVPAVEEAA